MAGEENSPVIEENADGTFALTCEVNGNPLRVPLPRNLILDYHPDIRSVEEHMRDSNVLRGFKAAADEMSYDSLTPRFRAVLTDATSLEAVISTAVREGLEGDLNAIGLRDMATVGVDLRYADGWTESVDVDAPELEQTCPNHSLPLNGTQNEWSK